jgi:hypothetical protein
VEIDRKLNLVLTVERGDGSILHVHSTPVRQAIFTQYYKIIAKTFSQIYSGGYGVTAAPRIAAMLLRDVAAEEGSKEGVQNGLINEIHRLTNVLVLGNAGWETLPLEDALKRGLLDEDDASEVENAVVFFTVASAMHKRTDLRGVLGAVQGIWGGRLVSSTCTVYASSLPMLIKAGTTGATVTASSIPS